MSVGAARAGVLSACLIRRGAVLQSTGRVRRAATARPALRSARGWVMRRFWLGLVLALGTAPAAPAAVVVLANFTPADLTVTVAETDRKPQTLTLARAQVVPVTVTGPSVVTLPTKPAATRLGLDPYHAYVVLPDPAAGVRLEGIELPGDGPERDARQELNPAPRVPVKIPVTLMVDDADPRADALWQATIRARFEEAAVVVAAHAGVRLEFAGFGTWRSDPAAKTVSDLRADFEAKVKVKPGSLAVGYTSRKFAENPKEPAPYGETRPGPTGHVLMREWAPKTNVEKVEVLIHQLGLALGAAVSADEGSVMREKTANGLALVPQYRFRFDPLNTLAMNLWADEFRRGPVADLADVSQPNRVRLRRVYQAMLKAHPGDSHALTYLNEFDRDLAKAPPPKKEPDPVPKKEPAKQPAPREEVVRAVVRAVAARAQSNIGADALTGDDLTAAYFQAAAAAALAVEGMPADSPDRTSGFLIGVAVALDDTDALLGDPLTADAVKSAETDADREARLASLGNPTIHGRRDLCRRFAVGCGAGEILPSTRAEDVAITRSLAPAAIQRPAGVSFPALAAELGGIGYGKAAWGEPQLLTRLAQKSNPAEMLPNPGTFRDGLSAERFEEEYGGADDERFRKVIDDIHEWAKKAAPR